MSEREKIVLKRNQLAKELEKFDQLSKENNAEAVIEQLNVLLSCMEESLDCLSDVIRGITSGLVVKSFSNQTH